MTNKKGILLAVSSMLIVGGTLYFHSINDKSQTHITYSRSALTSQYKLKPLANESSSTSDDDTTVSYTHLRANDK